MAASPGLGPVARPETGSKVPKVVAVVLNWCKEEETAACLKSLLACRYPQLQVLLVDNGSPDGSGARLRQRFPQIEHLQTGANLGYTGGNNRGIEWSLEQDPDYVLILNNDTEVEPGMLSTLVATAEADAKIGVVGPKILYFDDPGRTWFAGGDFSVTGALGRHRGVGEPEATSGEAGDVTFLSGCCLLVRSDLLRRIGAFDDSFFAYLEDVDFSLRVRDAGHRLVYQPEARLRHKVPLHEEPSPFQITQRDRNRRRLVRKRYRARDRLRFAIFFYPSRLVRLAGYLLRGEAARARAIWRGMTAD